LTYIDKARLQTVVVEGNIGFWDTWPAQEARVLGYGRIEKLARKD
jgi:hypothetical protein